MAVLKKIPASTLMETLVATVLLIVIFTVASLTVNHLFGNTVTHNTQALHTRFHELEYRHQHRELPLPYAETYLDWDITVSRHMKHNMAYIRLEATNPKTSETITKINMAHVETP